jgi:endonuclease-3 related protein
MVGAVLTQNTAWSNVEKAIINLKSAKALDAQTIAAMEAATLAELIRPAGYFNVKAKRLQNLCRWLLEQGGEIALQQHDDAALRRGLLSVNGVGPETADDILLYAFDRPIFVIDAYTRRIFKRLGLINGDESYEQLRNHFEQQLGQHHQEREQRAEIFNEYHALIVIHAKEACRTKPLCDGCCLRRSCPAAG